MGLIFVISYPTLRKPDKAARVVCGNQPRVELSVVRSAPPLRLSMAISLDFLVAPTGAETGFESCALAVSEPLIDLKDVCFLGMGFSLLILQGTSDPATDQSPVSGRRMARPQLTASADSTASLRAHVQKNRQNSLKFLLNFSIHRRCTAGLNPMRPATLVYI